ncbi:Putative flippase GtrA (transmembrane translocase of bactoprenol-linked glucose) [Actinokineospora alba]|uniref:Putative flippase GtrA (Transmembrane translocase of bactoprenol-linked glucose) n=1 Tax=Actinokineospora alba TaxID=504798 RepID=A0A1H0RM55_9PSEU|nr:putative flippase GtrA [Actinokineospora alba]SDJ31634.1 Putative flippase GtrA (transmembrane translocase of bactoprenol-linked glucose) [Actinokineospora alba]SDP30480.1 Putative flippase GtrA (transmembrane translocase of bactoprenol-linked glucose) [Actinokineospora alba]
MFAVEGRLVRWVTRHRVRFSKYAVASMVATGITQLVLYGLYSSGGFDATSASAIGFVAGAVPHFVMIRWWAWRQRGMPRLTRQVVGYLVVTGLGGFVSVGLTTLAELVFSPLVVDRDARTLVLIMAYLLGGLPVFVAKFAFLDRVFGQVYEATSSTSVRAANPVAPGTTSS